jgi:hypothetical protein
MRRLIEWVAAPPKPASNGNSYKEKFKKLLDYHMKHLDPIAVDPEIKILRDDSFMYYEHHATGAIENDYDKEVAGYINKAGDWEVATYKNGTCVKTDFGNGYEEFLKAIDKVLNLPAKGSPEYQELLESKNFKKINKGVNIAEFSDIVGWESSARDWARALINTLEDVSVRIIDYYEMPDFCDFVVNQHGDILTYRVHPGGELTIRDSSFADDFKEYEKLWN